jgi:AcrR family transcriptional regulator
MKDSGSSRIYRHLREQILTGALGSGDPVPSARQIKQTWGVAIATASKALARLRQDGLVVARQGVGTMVAARSPTPPPAAAGAHELGVGRIVACAIAIADRTGLPALSMRTIATELGAATMSIYRYIAGKEQLVELMIDAVFGEATLPASPPAGWRARLELYARALWKTFLRHPWLPHVMSLVRPQLAPNGMVYTEWAMRALEGTGLDLATKIRTAISLVAHARAHALDLEREHHARQDSGMTVDEWFGAQAATLNAIIAARSLPLLAQVAATPAIALDPDTLFGFGLERLLDGIAVLIQHHARPTTRPITR